MITLNITAADGDDLRSQLLAIVGVLPTQRSTGSGNVVADPVMPEVKEAETKPTRAPRKLKAEPEVAASADQKELGAETAEPSEDSPAAEAQSSTSAETTESPAGPANGAVTIEDIRNLTLEVVDKRGREKIEEILTQFGVPKATQVEEARRGELADMLREALEPV